MPRLIPAIAAIAAAIGLAAACTQARPAVVTATTETDEVMSGGGATVHETGPDAFARPAPGLDRAQRRAFNVGNSFFNDPWVVAPASAEGRDGLGPLFNATSCSGCHFRDGRGRPPEHPGDPLASMLLRISIDAGGGDAPHPVYGGQWQDKAIPGVPAEGPVRIDWRELPGTYADGLGFSLRAPVITLPQPAYGDPGPLRISPRTAPAVFGLGLLEAIPEADLIARADPADRDGDGISGRPNRVPDVRTGGTRLGRFGWKAGQPSIEQQSAGAFNGDLGVTSSLFPADHTTPAQTAARTAPNGGEPELSDHKLQRVVEYCATLAVPAARAVDDPQVLRGKAVFAALRCDACHVPAWTTGTSPVAALANQRIRPYTDLLLHDLGEGLADHRPEAEATGTEWRTPPLWGLGLQQTVNGHLLLLHDGRARGVAEAILWHGGEAQAGADAFRALPAADRDALVAFVLSR